MDEVEGVDEVSGMVYFTATKVGYSSCTSATNAHASNIHVLYLSPKPFHESNTSQTRMVSFLLFSYRRHKLARYNAPLPCPALIPYGNLLKDGKCTDIYLRTHRRDCRRNISIAHGFGRPAHRLPPPRTNQKKEHQKLL